MKKNSFLLLIMAFSLVIISSSCHKKIQDTTTTTPPIETEMVGIGSTDVSKYTYETVPGDPLGVKIYTLKNGMKVYMSVNKDEPRIQTNIAVRAGSKHDPADATGLAHYLEHMLFKGTNNIGSLDWEKESALLDQISDLYEQHRVETDETKRKEIYAKIDEVSNEAAKLVAANEYDKMVSSLGAKGTNAYTWVEQTVYVNDIPSNELDRWMKLESERFKMVVLRLFHTELEAVYEEFNIGQDNDGRKSNKAISQALFPNHPYGTQTTIGTGPHLKNPSHVKIKEYFDKYYVPNNMAIIVSGDFDPDDVAAKAEKYFGDYKRQDVPKFTYEDTSGPTSIVKKEVIGQEAEYVDMAWRFGGATSDDPAMLRMIKGLLYNQQAGLIDINLVQKQKVLEGDASTWAYEDYGIFSMYGKPREGQSLEDVEKLLIGELENIKKGNFDEWLMKAVIKDAKLGEIRSNEYNRARTSFMTNAFILGVNWKDYVNRIDAMEKITKQQIVDFANKHFKDNYVVVYKRTGEDKSSFKVDKPAITPVSLNREESSTFTKDFMSKEAPSLSPVFVNYKDEIMEKKLSSGVPIDYIKNKNNQTFSLDYIVEMGKDSDKLLPLAITLLPYLGTDKYSAAELQKEFFKLGLSFDVYSGNERVYVSLNGLDESLEDGVKLFEHVLANVKGDDEALKNVISDALLSRENNKKNKRTILRSAMANYARYGKKSAFTDQLSEAELKNIRADQLVKKIKELTAYEHRIFYYGSQSIQEVVNIFDTHHKTPPTLKPVLEPTKYKELATTENKVYFVDFPMVQAEVLMLSKGTQGFSPNENIMKELYNNYFGFGLSSIVFQEIRESKALAYSAYAYYSSPSKKDKAHYLQAYVGTQVDKLKDAIPAMQEIIENIPISDAQIETARQSILKKIETERVNKTRIYWSSRSAKDLGYDYDMRKDIYEKMKNITVDDLKAFHKNYVKGRNYTVLVLGSKESVDMDYLKTIGNVEELTLKEVFGY